MCIQWNLSLMEEAHQKASKVENVAASIVREYLFRKGCSDTLNYFEYELPRNASSISNRLALIKELDLHKSFKKNKTSEYPFRTILEVITEGILEKASQHQSISKISVVSSAPNSKISVVSSSPNLTNQSENKANKSSANYLSSRDVVPSRKCLNQDFYPKNKTPLKGVGKGISKCSQTIDESDLLKLSLNIKAKNPSPTCDKKQNPSSSSISPQNPRERRRLRNFEESPHKSYRGTLLNGLATSHLQDNDKKGEKSIAKQELFSSSIDMSHHNFDSAIEGRIFSLAAETPDDYSCLRPINADEACSLRILLFGNTKKTFGPEWSKQGFTFWNEPPLTYGMIQKKPGPCGVLAAVQAHIILELMFGVMKSVVTTGYLRPNIQERREALARALASILWQAGEEKMALLVVKHNQPVLDDFVIPHLLTQDGFLEFLKLRIFNDEQHLLEYLFNIVPELEDGKSGSCVLFLYSAILTRGIEKIKKDMDNPESHLIGEDGYCSQEVVNLLLIGRAVPNVFDGNMELYSDTPDKMILHGIPEPSRIGQLSLYEHQNTCQVGTYYKNPMYPIWIIQGESHFSVLFALSCDILEKTECGESFHLFYYDGLLKGNEEKRLLVEPSSSRHLVPGTDDDFLPAVIRCIRTRWKDATVKFDT